MVIIDSSSIKWMLVKHLSNWSGRFILPGIQREERGIKFRGKMSFFVSSSVKAKSSKMSRQNVGEPKSHVRILLNKR